MTILLGNLKIEYPPLPETSAVQEERLLAVRIAAYIRGLAEGSRDSPDTWVSVASRIGCLVYPFHIKGAGLGEYASTTGGGDMSWGVITYNTACTRSAQVATLIHELAHHVLVVWGIVPASTVESTCHSAGDNMAHRVARRVERILAG